MRFLLVPLVLAASAASLALADDPAPPAPPPARAKPVEPRKFEPGKLSDPYWGLTYALAGLEEKKTERPAGKLFDGRAGKVQIEVNIWEYADELSAKDRRNEQQAMWERKGRARNDAATGDDPAPWITFQEEGASGGMRRHGYAWYVRGCRAFVVHTHCAAENEGAAEGVKAALFALTVGPETGAAVFVPVVSREMNGIPYDDPGVLHSAGEKYLQDVPPRLSIAEGLLRRSVAALPGSRLERSPTAMMVVNRSLGNCLLQEKKFEEGLGFLQKALEFAAKTDSFGPDQAAVHYDIACAYSQLGKLDEAFATLTKAFANPNFPPPVPDDHLKKDPDLENCRKDPRWAKFLADRPAKK